MSWIFENVPMFVSVGALIVSIMALQNTTRQQRVQINQKWIEELRTKLAALFSELETPSVRLNLDQPRKVVDERRVTFLVEYLCLMLGQRTESHYRLLRGAVVKLALEDEHMPDAIGQRKKNREIVGKLAGFALLEEAQSVERSLRWLPKMNWH